MQLLILILGSVLLPKAYSLLCYECTPGPSGGCTTTKECIAPGAHCAAVRVVTNMDRYIAVSDVNVKTCVWADQCVSGSINYGLSRTVISTRCCSTDLCNSQPAPGPRAITTNGKQCYGCTAEGGCTSIITCLNDEDRCITTTVDKKLSMRGCASKSMCSGTQAGGAIGTEVSCCEDDLCNGPSDGDVTTSSAVKSSPLSLLLMMARLAQMVYFALFF